jgi:tetratricopeptide (TPR) repeat protein
MTSLQRHLLIEQAYRAYENGAFLQAELFCRELLKQQKNDVQALRLLGVLSFARSLHDEAISYFKRCLTIQPKDPSLHYDLARALSMQGRYDEALESIERTLKMRPGQMRPLADKADIFERRGDREAAWAILGPYYESSTEDEAMAVVLVRLLDHEGNISKAIELARRHVSREKIDPASRTLLLRHLGRMCEKIGDYEAAFNTFDAANKAFARAKSKSAGLFDAQAYVQSFDNHIATFSKENLALLPRAKTSSELPVFIACMPRSGSTLVEQIIHAHPKAFGAGEIPHLNDIVNNLQIHIESFQTYPACIADLRQEHVDRLSQQYLTDVAKLGRGAMRIANKHLRNYLHLGMIWVLFPKARIIHIRRDRLDNCFGCYMAALSPIEFPWASDLRSLGVAWRQYERLMDHWRNVLDLPMLEVQYEDLVENTEAQIRRIIDFCGLEWNDRCLRYWDVDRTVMTLSYDQVRQPIFKSAVKRYEKYEQFLGPLKEALGMS